MSVREVVQDLLRRADDGEFLGQSDGNLIRAESLVQHFRYTQEQVAEAVDAIDGHMLVAGVILPLEPAV